VKEIIFLPMIPKHKYSYSETLRVLEEINPDYIIIDRSPKDNVDELYENILQQFGLLSEKIGYVDAAYDFNPEKIIIVKVEEEDFFKELPQKAGLIELIKFNIYMKKLQKKIWKSLEEFLSWFYKQTYRVEILKASEVALSKKILKEIEALPENSKIVIVCEYTLLRALKSIIHNLIVYNNKVVDFSNITYI